MNLQILFQAVEAIAVVVGVGFGVHETRRYRRDRNRDAALELLHAFQTWELAKAITLVYRLVDRLSKKQIESLLGEDLYLSYAMSASRQ